MRQNLTQSLNLGRQPVDHAAFMAGPHMAVVGVRADALLLLGSPLAVVGQDVGQWFATDIIFDDYCVFVWRHGRIPPVYQAQ